MLSLCLDKVFHYSPAPGAGHQPSLTLITQDVLDQESGNIRIHSDQFQKMIELNLTGYTLKWQN